MEESLESLILAIRSVLKLGKIPEIKITLPKANSSHLPGCAIPKGNYIVFQPSIFRCELLVKGGYMTLDLIRSNY